MKLTNRQIYSYCQELNNVFSGIDNDRYIPTRINFYIQKAILTLNQLGQEIEQAKIRICDKYGTINKEGTAYDIHPENMDEAQKELDDLFNIEQDVNIITINLSDMTDVEFSVAQMKALMFMIKED